MSLGTCQASGINLCECRAARPLSSFVSSRFFRRLRPLCPEYLQMSQYLTMDIHCNGRTLHLPQEVIICIASHLSLAPDIRSIRLVNRALNVAGTAVMILTPQSPSTLFTRPTPTEVKEVEQAQPFEYLYRYTPRPLTIWTWLQIPDSITIEDCQTDLGREFVKLVVAPSSASYMDNHSASGKDRVDKSSGRKGTCLGRAQERPDEFCIIMRVLSSSTRNFRHPTDH